MKLKPDLIIQEIGDCQYLVPMGAVAFQGVVRCNAAAAFIVECLKEETTKEKIVDAMCAEYNAPRSVIEADVKQNLDVLRSINALEETESNA